MGYAAISAVNAGYQVFAVVDASGTYSKMAEEITLARVVQAGVVPIAANTLLTGADYDFMLGDSRARAIVVSEALWPQFASILANCPNVKHVIVSGANAQGRLRLQDLFGEAGTAFATAATSCAV